MHLLKKLSFHIRGRRGRGREELCPRLLDDDQTIYERTKQQLAYDQQKKLDLSVDGVVEVDGVQVVAGSRASGTRVTTLVALDSKGTETWRVSAAKDALTAEGAPRNLAAGGGHACILYYSTEYRIGCFALADGARVWDAEAPSTANGLQISKDALVITTARNIEVRELGTGKVRWSMD